MIQICEDIGFRSRWSQALPWTSSIYGSCQVGAVTLFMPEDFSNQIFERLHPAKGVFGRMGESWGAAQVSTLLKSK